MTYATKTYKTDFLKTHCLQLLEIKIDTPTIFKNYHAELKSVKMGKNYKKAVFGQQIDFFKILSQA